MDNYIINIGRQPASGGKRIGKKIASELNCSFYDKELLKAAAEDWGLDTTVFEKADEKAKKYLFSNFIDAWSPAYANSYTKNYLGNNSLFKLQSETIKRLAECKPAVFVGRCADYILRDHPRCVNIFICANEDDRIRRIAEKYDCTQQKAEGIIEKMDKNRTEYYNFYTNKIWGASPSYHLCINSSLLGVDQTTDFLLSFIRKKLDF